MIADKVKAVLSLNGKTQKDLADHFGVTKQTLNNKFHRDSFTGADLIRIAAFCGCTLSFDCGNGTQITFTPADLKTTTEAATEAAGPVQGGA